jgi:hypothetical protein
VDCTAEEEEEDAEEEEEEEEEEPVGADAAEGPLEFKCDADPC